MLNIASMAADFLHQQPTGIRLRAGVRREVMGRSSTRCASPYVVVDGVDGGLQPLIYGHQMKTDASGRSVEVVRGNGDTSMQRTCRRLAPSRTYAPQLTRLHADQPF